MPAERPISAEVIITLKVPRRHWPAISQAVHAQTEGEPYRASNTIYILDRFSTSEAMRWLRLTPRPRHQAALWLYETINRLDDAFIANATEWHFESR